VTPGPAARRIFQPGPTDPALKHARRRENSTSTLDVERPATRRSSERTGAV